MGWVSLDASLSTSSKGLGLKYGIQALMQNWYPIIGENVKSYAATFAYNE